MPQKPKHVYEVLFVMKRERIWSEVTRYTIVNETRMSYLIGEKLKNRRAFSKKGIGKRFKVVSPHEFRYSGYVLDEMKLPELIEFIKSSAMSDFKDMIVGIRDASRHLARWKWNKRITERTE